MKRFVAVHLLAGALLIHAIAAGDEEKTLEAALRSCADRTDARERLACFDRIASKLPNAEPESRARMAAEGPPEQAFGKEGSELARREVSGAPRADSISAAVTALSRRPHGELVVTLGNGQVWLQKQAAPYFPLRVGETVTIRRSALGSYQLRTETGRVTRVTRIQ